MLNLLSLVLGTVAMIPAVCLYIITPSITSFSTLVVGLLLFHYGVQIFKS